MSLGIYNLAIVIALCAVLGIAAKFLRQPTVLAYLAAGAALGFFHVADIREGEAFKVFSELGIMFLLFLVGLEINYTSLRLVGRASVYVGLGQIFFAGLFGVLICLFLGFGMLASLYISTALTFSSTIIIVKLLSDKKELNSLYGRISIGYLLVQDIVAILVLMILTGLEAGEGLSVSSLAWTLIKGTVLFVGMFWLGRATFPHLFNRIARSPELVFLSSLAWLFIVAGVINKMGFSIEIAGFLAGVALANSSEHHQIASRIRPLRDFFILVFFVTLGSSIAISNLGSLGWPIIILSLFVLIGNPLIILAIMGSLGFRKRTGFLAGITSAQVSEFSLILAALGYSLGHIDRDAVTVITAVGVITIAISTYLIVHAEKLYKISAGFLSFFEKHTPHEPKVRTASPKPIILIGYHRLGRNIARMLKKKDLLIIDFDPEIIDEVKIAKYSNIFGDISDEEILEQAGLDKARLIISTSPDLDDNLMLLDVLRSLRHKPKIILRSETEHEARILYDNGADYVLLPHISAGNYLGRILAMDPELKMLKLLKNTDLVGVLEKANEKIIR